MRRTKHSRRDVLRGSAGLAGAGLLAGCSALSPVGGEEAAINVQADDETITGSSRSGKVEDVTLNVSGTVEWLNLPYSADGVVITAYVQFDGERKRPIGDTAVGNVKQSSYEFGFGTDSIVANDPGNPVVDTTRYDLSATEDGETNTTNATVTIEAVVEDGDGETIVSDSVSVPLTIEVTNEPGNPKRDPEVAVTADVSGEVEME